MRNSLMSDSFAALRASRQRSSSNRNRTRQLTHTCSLRSAENAHGVSSFWTAPCAWPRPPWLTGTKRGPECRWRLPQSTPRRARGNWALEWLEWGLASGYKDYGPLARNPIFEHVRGDARFAAVLRKWNRPWPRCATVRVCSPNCGRCRFRQSRRADAHGRLRAARRMARHAKNLALNRTRVVTRCVRQ